MVYATQSGYYKAIEESSQSANYAPFIDFMLEEVLKTLKLSTSTPLSLTETKRASLKNIAELKKKGVLQREGARKNGRWKVLPLTHEPG